LEPHIKTDNIEIAKVGKNAQEYDIHSNGLFLTNSNFIDRFIITESLRRA